MTLRKNPADLLKPGAPTTYKPEYCEFVVEQGKLGDSLAQMASKLDTTRKTLWDWAKANPAFGEAIARAREHAMAWWETTGRRGMGRGKEFNAQVWSRSMAARFPDDYREQKDVNLNVNTAADDAVTSARKRLGG